MEIGTRVKNIDGDRGTVSPIPNTGSIHNGFINVVWDYNGKTKPELASNLIVIDTDEQKRIASKVQDKIDKAASAFEFAFKMIEEARSAASEDSDLNSMESEGLIDCSVLSSFEGHGWSSSSLYC